VEADIGAGLPRTVLVGLPDSALYQSRDRCKAAVSNSGQEWPISLLTINLSPAMLPKAGSHYDLAIVAAVLAAQGIFRAQSSAAVSCSASSGWMVVCDPYAASCLPRWQLSRLVSRE
jgi:predicted ATPase with chaperone activity